MRVPHLPTVVIAPHSLTVLLSGQSAQRRAVVSTVKVAAVSKVGQSVPLRGAANVKPRGAVLTVTVHRMARPVVVTSSHVAPQVPMPVSLAMAHAVAPTVPAEVG